MDNSKGIKVWFIKHISGGMVYVPGFTYGIFYESLYCKIKIKFSKNDKSITTHGPK